MCDTRSKLSVLGTATTYEERKAVFQARPWQTPPPPSVFMISEGLLNLFSSYI